MQKIISLGLLTIALCTSCISFEKPGQGEAAIYGLKCMYIIQDEIYKYKLKHNKFPDDLTFLIGIDIPIKCNIADNYMELTELENTRCNILYRNFNDYFELLFTYSPPGMNRMKYDSVNKKWMISGYY